MIQQLKYNLNGEINNQDQKRRNNYKIKKKIKQLPKYKLVGKGINKDKNSNK